jgi:hypothetical protein
MLTPCTRNEPLHTIAFIGCQMQPFLTHFLYTLEFEFTKHKTKILNGSKDMWHIDQKFGTKQSNWDFRWNLYWQ